MVRLQIRPAAVALAVLAWAACDDTTVTPAEVPVYENVGTVPGCTGNCQVRTNCSQDRGPTTLTGVVNIPAGNLPIYGAKVYIPLGDLPPAPTSGVSCDRCDSIPPSVAYSETDFAGRFTLVNVPSGKNIPLIVRVGKWRRVVTLTQEISECTSTELDPGLTRLPRNQTEGNIPKIAISTGYGDALECILRKNKLGLDDTEFGNPNGTSRVNLFAGGLDTRPSGGLDYRGTLNYSASLNGGASFPASSPAWDSAPNFWNKYDAVLLSCEGNQLSTQKSSNARAALLSYINAGGRVFASHWHNYFIKYGPAPLNTVASFVDAGGFALDTAPIAATVNQSQPKPKALANWLMLPGVGGSTQLGQLAIEHSRVSLTAQVKSPTLSWVDFSSSSIPPGLANPGSQYFSFNAPIDKPEKDQCGQMVFTDMHVSGAAPTAPGDHSGANLPFPTGCTTTSLTAQEKALIFMLFDLTNCVAPLVG